MNNSSKFFLFKHFFNYIVYIGLIVVTLFLDLGMTPQLKFFTFLFCTLIVIRLVLDFVHILSSTRDSGGKNFFVRLRKNYQKEFITYFKFENFKRRVFGNLFFLTFLILVYNQFNKEAGECLLVLLVLLLIPEIILFFFFKDLIKQ